MNPAPYIFKERDSVFITNKPPILWNDFDTECLRPMYCEKCGSLFYKSDDDIAQDTGFHTDLCKECQCEAEFFIM